MGMIMNKFTKKYFTPTKIFVAHALIGQLSFLLVPNILLSKMNNHEHQTKQTYESYTFQPLMSFSVAYYMRYLFQLSKERLHVDQSQEGGGVSRVNIGFTDHCQCDVTSYIADFQNGGQISCSLCCKGCQFSERLDSSFAFFNKAELLKKRKVPRSVYKLAQFV